MNTFDRIPLSRLLAYLMAIGLLPIIFVGFGFLSDKKAVNSVQERLENLRFQALLQEQRQAGNLAVVAHYRDADHFYIDKHLETVTLLEPEIEALQKVTQNKSYTGDETVQKRLEHLTGTGNGIVFTEGMVQSYPLFQETTESLSHPIETNVEDLKKLLALIEGVPVGEHQSAPNRPQLLIIDFKLDKKTLSEKNDVYILNLKLLKREYL